METLTTTNALMKEDLAISKNSILALQDENRQLKQKLEAQKAEIASSSSGAGGGPENCSSDTEVDAAQLAAESESTSGNLANPEVSKKLQEEKIQKERLEVELQAAQRQKDEMEEAMKQMEKDVHEKQDTIISLRSQLDDIKMINLEMYKKLQVHIALAKNKY